MTIVELESSGMLNDISPYTVADLMSREVLTVYEGWSVKRLAGFFVRHNIAGAPVVASDDELVGVVSQSDVVRFESRSPADSEIERMIRIYCGPYSADLTAEDIAHLKERASETCTVNSIMTPKVISVDPLSKAIDACIYMVESNLHRLFVTEKNKLVGVISAMDFLRKMVKK